MAIYSKQICKRELKIWIKAAEAIATGQRYQMGSRMLTRADLKEVREQIKFWETRLADAMQEEKRGGRSSAYRVVQRDV